jgi:uncharacterized protein YbbK (DUF523 family)
LQYAKTDSDNISRFLSDKQLEHAKLYWVHDKSPNVGIPFTYVYRNSKNKSNEKFQYLFLLGGVAIEGLEHVP